MNATRTTLSIDDDVLAYARQLAADSGRPLGAIISELARASLHAPASGTTRNGIALLPTGENARRATLQDVNRLRDELP